MNRLRVAIERFLDERFPMPVVRHFMDKQAHKRLPPHTGWLHVFGSLSLIAFLSQIITGILLLFYYRPTPEEAHKSIQYITAEVNFGWLYRQIHAWGATLMILAVILHMARTFFMGSYKKPRELTWVVGVLILLVTINFGFTGYLLPWNQLSYWATTVGTEVAGAVPFMGPWLKKLMLGGESVGAETLSRFFTLHVIILPWVLAGLVGLHLLLMRSQNLATMEPVGQEKPFPPKAGVPFWPVHVAKESCVALVTLGVLITLSVVSPWEIGEPANPLETPEAIKPEWYFLPTFQLLKYFTGPAGKVLGIIVSTIPFLLLMFWPFLDRSPARHPRQRPISVSIGIIGIVLALILGALGHWAETRHTIFGRTYQIDTYGVPRRVQPDRSRSEDTVSIAPRSPSRADLEIEVLEHQADLRHHMGRLVPLTRGGRADMAARERRIACQRQPWMGTVALARQRSAAGACSGEPGLPLYSEMTTRSARRDA